MSTQTSDGETPDFCLIEPDSPEVLSTHDTREGDYELVIGSDEKEPERGLVERLQTISAPRKFAEKTMKVVYNHLLDSSPVDLLNPFAFAGVVAQATLAVSVQQMQGATFNIDYKEQIDNAKKHLEDGKDTFSDDQKRVVQGWIEEAESRLKTYMEQESGQSQGKSQDEKAKKKPKKPKKTPPDSPVFDARRFFPPTPPPSPPKIPKITLRSLIEGSKDNPKMDILTQRDPQLATVLQALKEFTKVPCRLQNVDSDEVDRNIEGDPAIGSSSFVNTLKSRAHTLAESLRNPRLKRILLAVSGPGTAKSTGCRLMFQWAKMPCCFLSGEAFRSMYTGQKRSYEVFTDWITEQILKAGVMGVGILLDDWQFAMEPGGPFDIEENKRSREKFLLFVKNCGDDSQKSVLFAELAPERKFPLNFSYVHLAMTFNRIPSDLYETADSAIQSRYFDLNASYATEEDRRNLALNFFLPQIKVSIAERMKRPITEIIFDNEYTKECILKVVEADITLFREKFKGQHGIRGLADLLQMYTQHILSRLPKEEEAKVDPRCFDLDTFDPRSATENIKDYNKSIDSETIKYEARSLMSAQLSRLREDARNLPGELQAGINSMIDKTETEKNLVFLENIKLQLELYKKRVSLAEPKKIGELLLQHFGHFRGSDESEVDRFSPIEAVVKNIYLRLTASRKGKYSPSDIIFSYYSVPQAKDSSIFQTVGTVLGGLPVLHISSPSFVIDSEINPRIYDATSTGAVGIGLNNVQFYGISPSGDKSVFTVNSKNFKHEGYSFIYCDNSKGEVRILTLEGIDAIAAASNGAEIPYKSTHFIQFQKENSDGKAIDWKSQFVKKIKPSILLLQNVADSVLKNTISSCDETLVVVNMGNELQGMIQQWSNSVSNPSKLGVIDLFVNELKTQMACNQVRATDGTLIDLRGITVFLDNWCCRLPDTLGWLIGLPPISGRSLHARNYLEIELKKIYQKVSDIHTLLDNKDTSEKKLTEQEERVFEALIEYDKKVAQECNEKGFLSWLPVNVIDTCISSLIDRVQTRLCDTFYLGVTFPTLKVFEAEWNEQYGSYVRAIDTEIRYREKQKKLIEEKKEQEKIQKELEEVAKKQFIAEMKAETKAMEEGRVEKTAETKEEKKKTVQD